jgi:uncharacterized protein
MAWIESHQSLARHPKLIRSAAELSTDKITMLGHLHWLWYWALDYAPTGDLTEHSATEIAEAAGWKGDFDQFLEVLVKNRLIDRVGAKLHLHDFRQYAGKYIEKKEKDRERKAKIHGENSSGIPAEFPGNSERHPMEVAGNNHNNQTTKQPARAKGSGKLVPAEIQADAKRALDRINGFQDLFPRGLSPTRQNLSELTGRLQDGYTLADLLAVIDVKGREARRDEKSRIYFGPITPFRAAHFEMNLNRAMREKAKAAPAIAAAPDPERAKGIEREKAEFERLRLQKPGLSR